jgi:hypothetical protein
MVIASAGQASTQASQPVQSSALILGTVMVSSKNGIKLYYIIYLHSLKIKSLYRVAISLSKPGFKIIFKNAVKLKFMAESNQNAAQNLII